MAKRPVLIWLLLASAARLIAAVDGFTVLDGELLRIDLASGEVFDSRPLGEPGEFDVTTLALDPAGELYGIDRSGARLLRIGRDGSITVVGGLGVDAESLRAPPDIAFDACGELWLITAHPSIAVPSRLYTVDPDTGVATLVGVLDRKGSKLAAIGDRLLAVAFSTQTYAAILVDVDPATAATFSPRALDPEPYASFPWLAYDEAGLLWGLAPGPIIAPPPPSFTLIVDAGTGKLAPLAFLGHHLDYRGLTIAPPAGTCQPGRCRPGKERHCLEGRRFEVEVEWRDFRDRTGRGQTVPGASDDSGLFFFFRPDNWELQVKILDGCGSNGHFWVLAGASTSLEYLLRVTDVATGEVREYRNPLGRRAQAIIDTTAFATCAGGAGMR